jgi:flagellar hook-associated protein 3 FlgL
MKTTLATQYRSLNNEMGRLTSTLEDLRNQAATGKKLIRPSDDPAAIRPVLSARSQIRATDRFISSLSTAGDRLANQDAYLDQAENLMVRAKEVAINAINGSMSDNDLKTLADEVGYIKTEMLSIANAQVGGQYIFGGYQEDTQPFVENGDIVSYRGDSNIKRLEASSGEYVQTNMPGNELFLGQTDLDEDGVMETTGQDVFSMLTDLERAIRGESGQVYNGNEALPIQNVDSINFGYVDADNGDYTLQVTDSSENVIMDYTDPADPVPLQLVNSEDSPLNLQPVMTEDGSPMSIADYAVYNPAFDASGITDPGAPDKPMYIDASGDIPEYNAAGEPVLKFKDSGGNDATVSLLISEDTPIQLREVPDLEKTALTPDGESMLEKLEDGANQIRSKRGLMGNNASRLESSKMHLEGVRVDLEQILSRYEDVDILDVITEITQTETAFEGALKVTGQVSKLSIFDYM